MSILCNPIDGSPPGSSVPGILQARILEWVAVSFSIGHALYLFDISRGKHQVCYYSEASLITCLKWCQPDLSIVKKYISLLLRNLWEDMRFMGIVFSNRIIRASPLAQQQSICLQCRRREFDHWVGKIPWRRAWQPTPVFLSGESHGQRSLAGYGHKESDMTEVA